MRNNHVELKGTLTRDIELSKSTKGNSFVKFSIACLRDGKDKRLDYINCIAFGQTADELDRVGTQDTPLEIVGNLRISSYEKDGKKNYSTSVVVESFEGSDN